MMFPSGPHLFPLGVFILMPSTFIITYIISISLGHTEVEFPYISDTGTYSPESCIFGQLLNFSAVLVGITMYIRYRQVQEYCMDCDHLSPAIPKLNRISVWTGQLTAVGISLVANFQESNVLIVHMIGAFMAFSVGLAYAWAHTWISYKMQAQSKFVCNLRLAICVIATLALFMTSIVGAMSRQKFHGKDVTKWYPEDGGFTEHIISTVAEWVMAVAFMFFFLSYVEEFKELEFHAPHVLTSPQLQSSWHSATVAHGSHDEDDDNMIT